MLVVVISVNGVAVPIMEVVDMVVVRHGLVPAVLAVSVFMVLMDDVMGGVALIHVPVMDPMDMSIMQVVDVVIVLNRDMTAVTTMEVVMIGMDGVVG